MSLSHRMLDAVSCDETTVALADEWGVEGLHSDQQLTVAIVSVASTRLDADGGGVSRRPRVARYFFNQIDGEYKKDDEGLEYATMAEARLEAVRYLGEVLRDHPTIVWAGEDFRVEVTDSNDLVIFTAIALGIDAPAGGRSINPALKPPSG